MRPEITISEKQIVVITPGYRLHLEFNTPQGLPLNTVGDKQIGINHEDIKQQFVDKLFKSKVEDESFDIPVAASTNKPSRAHTCIKNCIKCGVGYKATSNAQRYCQNCKPGTSKPKKLDEMEGNELDKTLAEIEARRKKPFTFD